MPPTITLHGAGAGSDITDTVSDTGAVGLSSHIKATESDTVGCTCGSGSGSGSGSSSGSGWVFGSSRSPARIAALSTYRPKLAAISSILAAYGCFATVSQSVHRLHTVSRLPAQALHVNFDRSNITGTPCSRNASRSTVFFATSKFLNCFMSASHIMAILFASNTAVSFANGSRNTGTLSNFFMSANCSSVRHSSEPQNALERKKRLRKARVCTSVRMRLQSAPPHSAICSLSIHGTTSPFRHARLYGEPSGR